MKCYLCPRNCNKDRSKEVGFCKAPNEMVIAKVMLHAYEEPILSPSGKSGAIFFSGCSLGCVYCQNHQISHNILGRKISPKELVKIFKKLEEAGAENIDLVTPTHYADKILEALKIYKPKVPVVWNTSGYEKPETLALLKGYVDIFLIDFKYFSPQIAEKLSFAKDYPNVVINALKQIKSMVKNTFSSGKMQTGIIVRHLVLPSYYKDSIKVLDCIKEILGSSAIVSIMGQYTPFDRAKEISELNRPLKKLEYKLVINHALELKLDNSLVQDLSSASSDYTPDFSSPPLKGFEID